jgi:outer membrane protein assembly factor BamC
MKRNLAYFLALVLLAGCSSMSDLMQGDKIEYKSSAKKAQPLEVPPDLTSPNRDDRYAVPEMSKRGSATLSTYNAERSGSTRVGTTEVLPDVAKVRMERAGTQRWLVVSVAPEKVWPEVKEFWQGLGFLIKTELPEAGVMETDWAENRAKIPLDPLRKLIGKAVDGLYSSGELDKFRTRLERGSAPGTTEIYISHRGMEEVYTSENTNMNQASTKWQPRAPDPELEAEFLRRMMVYFGVADTRAKAEIVASEEMVERAKLVRASDGGNVLQMDDAFDRAWRRVGLALDRVGFTVEDRDRSKGYYFVRYVDPQIDSQRVQEKEGFLSKLAFWKSEPSKIKAEQYRVLVRQSGNVSEVQVQNKDGQPDNSDTGQRILSLLHQQLK